ncbi:2980_t:CDS:1 [Ambispora gerdemannii]|uniref:2980_t:CDS:1 n=1 Tax=Ambispora gerdemannii TaxID=144530 RepID=A0A9N9DIH6_9GLOM|nr:2980_t:CDS:1 [Ambispora gerdemannii]
MKGLWKNKKYQQKSNGNMEIKTKGSNKKEFSFPPEKEMQKVIKRFSDPNYNRVNIGLTPNASELDKAKYDICQSISRYKRVSNLTPSELAKKLKISKERTDDILFGRISNFDFEELVSYTEKLNGHLKININYDGEKASARAS